MGFSSRISVLLLSVSLYLEVNCSSYPAQSMNVFCCQHVSPVTVCLDGWSNMLLDHFAEQDIPCVVRQNAFSSIVHNCLLSILAVDSDIVMDPMVLIFLYEKSWKFLQQGNDWLIVAWNYHTCMYSPYSNNEHYLPTLCVKESEPRHNSASSLPAGCVRNN